ncbi:MAG TPA: DUF1800 domain-containing protein [Blastocatellia bacterium]|nr:DUF1800 domain-containing protein [Blastocatellia bacterium]
MRDRSTTLVILLTTAFILGSTTFAARSSADAGGKTPDKPVAGAGPATWKDDLSPIDNADWNYARAGHLLERAGFGGAPEEIEKLAKMTPQQAVSSLVDYETIQLQTPPFDESGIFDAAMLPDVDNRLDSVPGAIRNCYRGKPAFGVAPNKDGVRKFQPVVDQAYYRLYAHRLEWTRATIWWANRMLASKRPLEEKLTLFWSSHFATENEKVTDYRLMLHQIEMLRQNANGNFRNLLIGVSKEPAMLVYLDNRINTKGAANENYAREIMELFSLGVGNYTEKDIKAAARAFTGWTNSGLKVIYQPELHDDGEKTFLGASGNFDLEQVVDIILKQKAAAEFITGKLFRFLVREDISPELNAKLASILRDGNYELKPLLKTIFLSKDFYSPASYATQIKSPVQLVISTYKKLGLTEAPGAPYFPTVTTNLGQSLGNPPNVKGWDGGRSWINPSTMLQRANFARQVFFPEGAPTGAETRVIPERYANAIKEAEERDKLAALGNQNAASSGQMLMAQGEVMTSAIRINSAPDYDLKVGVYRGYVKAFTRVKEVPPTPAIVSLTAMAKSAGVKTADDAVDYFLLRFLRVAPPDEARTALVEFVKKQWGGPQINYGAATLEKSLRELAHLIMSTPEYQLS